VRPGQKIVAEWDECHWVGQAGRGTLIYKRLVPGNYWLRVAATGMDDVPIAPEASLNFVVLTPVWYRLSFWLVVGSGGTVGAYLVARQLTRRRMQRQVDRLERQHTLERERTRIARDIHDDLGTTLTQISMLSESARDNPGNPPATVADLDRICAAVRESTQAMDEIVWAADPENDSLDELATYISGFAQDLLNELGVRCRLDMPARFPAGNLSAEVRHNLFLAFKEALNNALRHGQPGEVRIGMALEQEHIILTVADDGRGFSQPDRAGHGLANMRKRVERLGGRFSLESEPGHGTRVRFEVPLSGAGLA
jgi:signal transduction histidine kinase